MRKGLALIFIFILIMPLLGQLVSAEQVEYFDFDIQRWYGLTPGDSWTQGEEGYVLQETYTIVASESYYWTFAYVKVTHKDSDGDDSYCERRVKVEVYVDDNLVASEIKDKVYHDGTFNFYIPFQAVGPSDTIVIKIYSSTGAGATIEYTVERIKVLQVGETGYAFDTRFLDPKYVPPGADDSSQGLLLNQTELLLNQTYNLSEGTVSLWLKWDNTTNLKISDNIGIDSNGYIYVKNNNGTTYTLEVEIPIGTYVPVYIGWSGGTGYIILNTTILNLIWEGTVTFTKIGNLSQSSETVIDEFKLWNEYIPSDQIIYESQRDQYTLLYNNTTIAIKAESGLSLGTIDVAFLNANYNTINSTTLSTGSKTATVPSNTKFVILTRGEASRTYMLDTNYSTIAFPAEGVTAVIADVQVTPESWSIMEVRTTNGAVATRSYLNNNVGSFTAILGNQYLFVFERDNETVMRLTTVKGDLVFYILTEKDVLTPPIDFETSYDADNNILSVIYYDQNSQTMALNITIEEYKNFTVASKFNVYENGTFGYYKLTTEPNKADYARVVVYALVNGTWERYEKTVPIEGGGRSPFPINLIPPALIVLGAAMVPMFLSRGTEPWLMLLGGAIGLTFVALIGWIQMTSEIIMLITALTVLGVLAMLAYRR